MDSLNRQRMKDLSIALDGIGLESTWEPKYLTMACFGRHTGLANQVASENYTIDARLGVDWKVRLTSLSLVRASLATFRRGLAPWAGSSNLSPQQRPHKMRFVKWQE